MECNGVLPTSQFAYRKGQGTCDAPFCMSHTLQSALESGQEARIVKIGFSVTFDRVNHHGILFYLSYFLCFPVASVSGYVMWRCHVEEACGDAASVSAINSALWVLEVLCCLYWHSFHETDHRTLWWMVVVVNWLTLCPECRRAVFLARYCASSTLRSFFPFWKIS